MEFSFSMNIRCPILVLGIGNMLLRDEGVGVHVIDEIFKLDVSDEVEVVDGGTSGADLLDVICNRQKVIIVDSVDSDVAPGTVLKMKPQGFKCDVSGGISLHELGIVEILAMTEMLDASPKDVVLICVKPKVIRSGLELSDEVAKAIPVAVQMVLEEISKVLPHTSSAKVRQKAN